MYYEYIFIPLVPDPQKPFWEFKAMNWRDAKLCVAGREGELYGKIYGEVGDEDYEPTAY